MPTLRDLDTLMQLLIESSRDMSLDEFKTAVLGEIRRDFAGQKIFVPESRENKRAQIEAATQTLPTGIVAERYGVSRSYVYRIIKRKN